MISCCNKKKEKDIQSESERQSNMGSIIPSEINANKNTLHNERKDIENNYTMHKFVTLKVDSKAKYFTPRMKQNTDTDIEKYKEKNKEANFFDKIFLNEKKISDETVKVIVNSEKEQIDIQPNEDNSRDVSKDEDIVVVMEDNEHDNTKIGDQRIKTEETVGSAEENKNNEINEDVVKKNEETEEKNNKIIVDNEKLNDSCEKINQINVDEIKFTVKNEENVDKKEQEDYDVYEEPSLDVENLEKIKKINENLDLEEKKILENKIKKNENNEELESLKEDYIESNKINNKQAVKKDNDESTNKDNDNEDKINKNKNINTENVVKDDNNKFDISTKSDTVSSTNENFIKKEMKENQEKTVFIDKKNLEDIMNKRKITTEKSENIYQNILAEEHAKEENTDVQNEKSSKPRATVQGLYHFESLNNLKVNLDNAELDKEIKIESKKRHTVFNALIKPISSMDENAAIRKKSVLLKTHQKSLIKSSEKK